MCVRVNITEEFRIKKNKPITKTCFRHLWDVFMVYRSEIESDSFKRGFVSYEFWKGKRFIGTIIGEESDDYIYIDTFLVNKKYRSVGNGKHIIDYIKSLYRYINVESTDEAFIFYKKMNFKKRKNQNNRIYEDTIDMYWKK